MEARDARRCWGLERARAGKNPGLSDSAAGATTIQRTPGAYPSCGWGALPWSIWRANTSRISDKLDFSKEDRIPDLLFSEVIWKAVRGEDAVMPAPRRSAFLNVTDKKDDDDDD